MAKDKFKMMQQGGGVGSFQETLVEAATTVAAIERQQEQQPEVHAVKPKMAPVPPVNTEQPRFMRLPNPQIPLSEYNLVSNYCTQFANMTRQDFVELAIIEKLYNNDMMTDEDFNTRYEEIRNRLPRGQRKGTRQVSR